MAISLSKIQEVKERADISKVCEVYGIRLNRAHKGLCPFHKEDTPSFSVSPQKQIFKCFGCGEAGDSIHLVSKLLNVNNYEAAKQINKALGLGIKFEGKVDKWAVAQHQQAQKTKEQFEKWENETFILLCDYLHCLEDSEEYYEIEELKYYIDIFIYGSTEDKLQFWKHNRKVVKKANDRLRNNNK